MDQQSIILYLARKGLSAVTIDEDLVATLGMESISYLSLRPHLREVKVATSNLEVTFSEPIHEHDDCEQAMTTQ
jgi:hypothetical protein